MRSTGREYVFRRSAAVIGWAAVAIVVFATLSPIGARPQLFQFGPHIERFAAYFLAAAALGTAYPDRRRAILFCIVAGAAGLEIAQLFASSRHARAADALVKILGGLAGLGLAACLDLLSSDKEAVKVSDASDS